MKRWWLSWYAKHGPFTYVGPWWVSGERGDGAVSIVAAVVAESEEAAKRTILDAHDAALNAEDVEWRFCNERADDWSPFTDCFPRAPWMRGPLAKEMSDAART